MSTLPVVDYTKRKSLCCDQDVAVGLSWREETELRKALYASMQKQKHHREKGDPPTDGADNGRFYYV